MAFCPSRIDSRLPLPSLAPMNCWPALGCTDCCEKVPAPRQNTVPVPLALTAFWMLEPGATETPEQAVPPGGGGGGAGAAVTLIWAVSARLPPLWVATTR